MIINLKDNEMNNYITWVYINLLEQINGINERITDTGWVNVELLNGAKLFTAGFNLQIRKIYNTVYMRGRITGLTEHPTTIAVLPQEFRPKDGYAFRFVVPSNGGTNAVFVFNPDSGTVVLDNTSDGQVPEARWFSFNNVVYCAE